MQIKVYVLDFQPSLLKQWVSTRFGRNWKFGRVSLVVAAALAVLAPLSTEAASELKLWQEGEALNARDLNANFSAVKSGMALPPKTVIHAYLSPSDAAFFDGNGLGISAGPYAGWALCNGKNGTPDLGNRFLRVNNAASGGTGGADTLAHTHAIDHDHATFSSGTEAGHTHGTPNHQHVLPLGWDSSNAYWTGDSSGLPAYGRSVIIANRSAGSQVGVGFGNGFTSQALTDNSGAGTSGPGTAHGHSVDPPTFAGTSGPASATENRPAYFELAALMRM